MRTFPCGYRPFVVRDSGTIAVQQGAGGKLCVFVLWENDKCDAIARAAANAEIRAASERTATVLQPG